MFDAVLIANRGEIAIRIARACRELGVRAVGVYSEVDRDALHVRHMDQAYLLGPAEAAASYLNIDKLLEVAHQAGVDAVHPGYGFLAENADFARAVGEAGLTFVGPSPEAIASMGDKLSARAVATAAGVPVVPGTTEPTDDPEVAVAFGDQHGYPVAVKAMFGGGGRGMKVVHDADQMVEALAAAQREAKAAFGRGECYLERYLARPRHIEIQVLADLDGTTIHLGERDCSLQRRHQKLVEEAPAPGISPELRSQLTDAALRIARHMHYTNAGTCEFLLDNDGKTFYFLEMNTRLQVEHPVTELITGIDLAQTQLKIAAGDGMGLTQDQITLTGHAIEARINAEDPTLGFLPTPGPIHHITTPTGPWTRLDTATEPGSHVPPNYDSMIAKLIVWAPTRDQARARMTRALNELTITGTPTTVPFHHLAMTHPQFAAAHHATTSVETEWDLTTLPTPPPTHTPPNPQPPTPTTRTIHLTLNNTPTPLTIHTTTPTNHTNPTPPPTPRTTTPTTTNTPTTDTPHLLAPMQGTITTYTVTPGDTVTTGQLICIIEAMKMENHIHAHRTGTITTINHHPGDTIDRGTPLATIT